MVRDEGGEGGEGGEGVGCEWWRCVLSPRQLSGSSALKPYMPNGQLELPMAVEGSRENL